METIPKSICVKIGFIQKPHGVRGELIVKFQEEFYETLEELPLLFLDVDQLLVPFFISEEGIRFKSGETVIVCLDWVDSDKKAKELCGLSVYVKIDDVVRTDNELMAPDELIGFRLYDHVLGLIGEIDEVTNYGGNLLLNVNYKGGPSLIPFHEELVLRLDDKTRELEMRLPEGLFNLDDE
jgi:16S rRNA processing protein RimM